MYDACSERSRFEGARAANRVPRRDTAAEEARVEAALDERLRHVAPDVEAIGAVHGHRLVPLQLGDPLLNPIPNAARSARHEILIARPGLSPPRAANLHTAAVFDPP